MLRKMGNPLSGKETAILSKPLDSKIAVCWGGKRAEGACTTFFSEASKL